MIQSILRFIAIMLLAALTLISGAGLVLWQTKNIQFFSVQTDSMRPELLPGDLAVVAKVQPAVVQPGDVISYVSSQDSAKVITHRVVKVDKNKGFLTTQGDNLAEPDPPVKFNAVVGKMRTSIPTLGYAFDTLRQPLGLIALIYIPGLILMSLEVRRLLHHYGYRSYRVSSRI